MDIATALGMMGLGLGVLSIVLGFLGVHQWRRTDQVLASEADKTRTFLALEGDKTRNLITEMRESTQVLIASEGDKTRDLVTELHESTKAFIATLSAEHAEILKRF